MIGHVIDLTEEQVPVAKSVSQNRTQDLENKMTKAPFEIGDPVDQNDLSSWIYTGLSGKPGTDKHAVRRFKKGMWVLEIYAHERPDRTSRVVSIRSDDADEHFWSKTRDRLMRNKQRQ